MLIPAIIFLAVVSELSSLLILTVSRIPRSWPTSITDFRDHLHPVELGTKTRSEKQTEITDIFVMKRIILTRPPHAIMRSIAACARPRKRKTEKRRRLHKCGNGKSETVGIRCFTCELSCRRVKGVRARFCNAKTKKERSYDRIGRGKNQNILRKHGRQQMDFEMERKENKDRKRDKEGEREKEEGKQNLRNRGRLRDRATRIVTHS